MNDPNLAQRDAAVVWHPFTQMKTAGLPTPIVRGEGAYLYTADGRQLIDAISSWWVNLHGHAHPYLAQRIFEQFQQLEHVIFADFTHEPAVRLSERLLEILPSNMARIFFSDNGSTAVEVALKMAFQYFHNQGITHKTKVIALQNSYHGDTFGSMSVSDRSPFTAPFFPFLFDVVYLPTPFEGYENEAIELLEQYLAAGDVAAFIFEPLVQGAGGMLMYSPEVLDQLVARCRAAQVLTIADEVMTGFGRTGRYFASDYLTNKPDLMAISKGLTGGTMPMGITVCTAEIFEAFLSDDKFKTFFHGHSYTANPLACAVANASLDLLQAPKTWQNIRRIEQQQEDFYQKISREKPPVVGDIRRRGTILAIELSTTQQTSYFNNIRETAYQFLLGHQILMRPLGNVIYILPPYCIKEDDLSFIHQKIEELFLFLAEKES
jgi:adenosylmethionine---8-amino-7-oxononanoate aminotransferase